MILHTRRRKYYLISAIQNTLKALPCHERTWRKQIDVRFDPTTDDPFRPAHSDNCCPRNTAQCDQVHSNYGWMDMLLPKGKH